MRAVALLAELEAKDVALFPEGDLLRLDAPAEALSPTLIAGCFRRSRLPCAFDAEIDPVDRTAVPNALPARAVAWTWATSIGQDRLAARVVMRRWEHLSSPSAAIVITSGCPRAE